MVKINKKISNITKIILLSFLFVGCNKITTEDNKNKNKTKIIDDYNIGDIYIKEIDSCEYIVYYRNRSGNIIHKENCHFCKLRKKNY